MRTIALLTLTPSLTLAGAFSADGKHLLYTPTAGGSPFSFTNHVDLQTLDSAFDTQPQ